MSVGAFGLDWLCRKLNRPPSSVYNRISYLKKTGQFHGMAGISQGTVSLLALCRATGYSESQIRRAGRAMGSAGQRWQRTSPRGRHMLSEDQCEAIQRWLAHDYWCKRRRLYACVWCGRDDAEPVTLGLCERCVPRCRSMARTAGLQLARGALLGALESLRAQVPDDWAEAWVAALRDERVLLTRSAFVRLLAEYRALSRGR